ncbi:hypothetical protein B0H65DRAFT_523694 [Neurospora tetraspora]|uniref:Uncharacterized protein n=1 Tax=Neurospora tetraspora TaxID=94610 RepID=A0AAE0JE43_9PEZI|nr:hypothetical protein B0H65DRAFT_523694 [Neurospora tetraspora]
MFQKLVNKVRLLLGSKRDGDEPGKSPPQQPPPPSYEAATATATIILSSLGRPADALFRKATCDRTNLVLTKEGKSVLFMYYILLEHALLNITGSYQYKKLPQHRAEGTPAASRAMVNAAGNYAFLLALLHASKQYNISEARLSLPVSEAVHAIREDVEGEIVKDLLQGNRYKEERHVMQELVDKVSGNIVTHAHVFDDSGGLWGTGRIRDSVDTGELDVSKVQECWRLFKSVLAETGSRHHNCGDLLPPPGFTRYSGRSQAALRGIC